MIDYDIVIVGAGVVGLAISKELSMKGHSVLVLEQHSSFGNETSSRNSEVIHAGIYYETNSLKSKLCVEGKKYIYEWCNLKNVPIRQTGKFIIALDDDEIKGLENLKSKALLNGVDDLVLTENTEVLSKNPGINCMAALYSPSSGIINSHILMESFIETSKMNNCDFAYNHKVLKIERKNGNYNISVRDTDGNEFEVTSKFFINSAGLNSDIIAQNAGIDIDKENYRLKYCKGHYFKLRAGLSNIATNLIYPVPPVNYSGLGVHITMDLAGNLKLGPDVLYLDNRNLDYMVDESLKTSFYESAKRYIPSLKLEDLSPDQSGIRPKLQGQGEKFRDFVIQEESKHGLPDFINLIGIESPGLTASIAIAKYIYQNYFN
jgi:L-2-hydroxyglutarate oxidase LhgO